ncbi:MAG TPA: lysophospholipid acyltransferase family protein [Jiangellaceae bacterium]
MSAPLLTRAGGRPATVAPWIGQVGGVVLLAGVLVSALRRLVWRAALVLTGGFRVDGRLPEGACVVVANHSSHADTAAVLAAIDAAHRPRVAAAADYWFARPARRAVCRELAAGFPVRRGGGGSDDLAAAGTLLAEGRAVVVFPEGTRSRHGEIGRFHTGAARLASSAGVPIVPVSIAGTGALLPAHGRIRRSPVRVRIGAPVLVTDPRADSDRARDRIVAGLREVEAQGANRDRRPLVCRPLVRDRVARAVRGWRGVALVGGWAFAEAISWPLLPEVVLFVVLLAAPRRWISLVPVAVVSGVVGGLVGWLLAGTHGPAPQPLVTDAMRETVVLQTERDGAAAVRNQPLSGIPYKVYVAHAGEAGVDPVWFGVESLAARGARIGVLGVAFAGLGVLVGRRQRAYPWIVLAAGVTFTVGLAVVVSAWEPATFV